MWSFRPYRPSHDRYCHLCPDDRRWIGRGLPDAIVVECFPRRGQPLQGGWRSPQVLCKPRFRARLDRLNAVPTMHVVSSQSRGAVRAGMGTGTRCKEGAVVPLAQPRLRSRVGGVSVSLGSADGVSNLEAVGDIYYISERQAAVRVEASRTTATWSPSWWSVGRRRTGPETTGVVRVIEGGGQA